MTTHKTTISWTDYTWNIARGCTKVSEGCKFCYMMRDGDRRKYNGFAVKRTTKGVFNKPLKLSGPSEVWDGPLLIFTSSLTDFFHEDIDGFRHEAWQIIKNSPHIYQILTKRPERIADHLPADWGEGYPNVWLGVSVEKQDAADERIPILKRIPAKLRFLSVEPLLGPVDLTKINGIGASPFNCLFTSPTHPEYLKGIDWVIVGGESGNDNGKWRYRPCQPNWISSIISQCDDHGVAVFVKQLGTYLSKSLGISRHGQKIEEWPGEWQYQQFPKFKIETT